MSRYHIHRDRPFPSWHPLKRGFWGLIIFAFGFLFLGASSSNLIHPQDKYDPHEAYVEAWSSSDRTGHQSSGVTTPFLGPTPGAILNQRERDKSWLGLVFGFFISLIGFMMLVPRAIWNKYGPQGVARANLNKRTLGI
jgi:hypothetical protein